MTESVGTESTQTFTRREVVDALNEACNDIIEAAQLGETGTVDALNLLVNATGHYLDHPDDRDLDSVVGDSYGNATSLQEVLSWFGE